ncbi:hypothetical protein BQ8482_250092 [Mesorhizobium delmotii]|uniref:Uncharacterized protein n=1 Tax=Mesorhizobium delmotii TaxID=1631247 RepID=A0A2P9AM52_9HYPH|nr:hypothetical protein BQ8482_250092 [Mesorhizobium delmotii]
MKTIPEGFPTSTWAWAPHFPLVAAYKAGAPVNLDRIDIGGIADAKRKPQIAELCHNDLR